MKVQVIGAPSSPRSTINATLGSLLPCERPQFGEVCLWSPGCAETHDPLVLATRVLGLHESSLCFSLLEADF